ncbi:MULTISPECIES: hypothetical protein [Bradyrhizobium]|jgi:hypothetical protein|uniref:Uncharacterized protein n=2 Tax=Bradyrhizobium TaxID=374 RepID=A0ABY0QEY3_9BRAD|nr:MULTISPECIES: hypothetical protein [Bradyrhizobium]SDK09970.1 hypothetical protein SAMN05444163_7218 [Bradyrhizobium ottawaense]SEE76883.1 hypothetical protein SAMN05444171_7956 [Bradyrhizobium lablabi]
MRPKFCKNAHEHTGAAETLRPSPRNGFTAYFVLAPVIGFLATVICENFRFHSLDASTGASGPHHFTVRSSALVSRAAASTASHRTFVTIALAPHLDETGEVKRLIWPTAEAKFCPSCQFVAAKHGGS